MLPRLCPLGLLLLLAGCVGPEPARSDHPGFGPDRSLVENVRASATLATLAAALDGAGLSETLDGQGPYTLFAPTDAAFALLPDSVRAQAFQPGSPELYNLLAYHLVPARLGAEGFDGRSVRTVNGAPLSIAMQDSSLTVNRRPIFGALPASNGTIYLIDAVLMPPGAQD